MKDKRITVRCVVYDGDSVTEVIEQAVLPAELPNVMRRSHFRWHFVEAMKSGKRLVFEPRKETSK